MARRDEMEGWKSPNVENRKFVEEKQSCTEAKDGPVR
jgi:hypothetical protein